MAGVPRRFIDAPRPPVPVALQSAQPHGKETSLDHPRLTQGARINPPKMAARYSSFVLAVVAALTSVQPNPNVCKSWRRLTTQNSQPGMSSPACSSPASKPTTSTSTHAGPETLPASCTYRPTATWYATTGCDIPCATNALCIADGQSPSPELSVNLRALAQDEYPGSRDSNTLTRA